jgi:hypothetical protein
VRYLASCVALCIAVFGPPTADASDVSSAVGKDQAKALDSPDGSSTAINYSPKGVVQAGTDKTTATVTVAKMWSLKDGVNLVNAGFTASSPFDSSKDDVVDVGTLSGLTAGTNARLELGYLHWPHFARSAEDEMAELCTENVKALYPGAAFSSAGPATVDGLPNLNAPPYNMSCFDLLNPDKIDDNVKAINEKAAAAAKAKKAPAPAPGPCPAPAPVPCLAPVEIAAATSAKATAGKAYPQLLQITSSGFATAWGVTLAATGNRQKFTFASMATPTKTTDEVDFGRGVSLTVVIVKSSAVFSAGAFYERSYKGAKEMQICSPIGTTGSSQCSTGALQAPKESTDKLLFVELRSAIERSGNLAISPRVEYKTTTSDVGIKLPIYFIPNDKRLLDGGISLGWTKEDHFTAGVFVGKAFSFF